MRCTGNLAWKCIVSAANLGREFRNYSSTWPSRAKKNSERKMTLTDALAGKSLMYESRYRESPSRDGQILVGNGTAGYVSPSWECNTYLETPDVVHRLGQISKSVEYANRRGNGTRYCRLYAICIITAPLPVVQREKSRGPLRGPSGKMATR